MRRPRPASRPRRRSARRCSTRWTSCGIAWCRWSAARGSVLAPVLLGALAGGALAVLPGSAGGFAAGLRVLAGGGLGWKFGERRAGVSPRSLVLAAFFLPVFTLAGAPGAGMGVARSPGRGVLGGP